MLNFQVVRPLQRSVWSIQAQNSTVNRYLGSAYVRCCSHSSFESSTPKQHRKLRCVIMAGTVAATAFGVYLYQNWNQKELNAATKGTLPVYSIKEVAEHNSLETGVWVTLGHGVYDITEFIHLHPGGKDKIILAAGGALEPFWSLYAVHKNPQILEILEQYRIGDISEEDYVDETSNIDDPYALEPRRHPALKLSSEKPFNAETPLSLLADSYITPSDLFYVRNHLPVPVVDVETYEVEISGLGVKTVSLSLDALKKYPKCTVTATIECAGNRRSEMNQIKQVKGLDWGAAAIGNATWTGARLRDVLIDAGFEDGHPEVRHVQFEGLDLDVTGFPYGASILIEKAMDPHGDVILAYEMNGQPLLPDHGFPVRVVVPGVVGARNVKWLGSIIVSKEESLSHWQQNDYKGFCPSVDWDTVDFKSAPAIQELPVVSAICDPPTGSTVNVGNGKVTVRGYAWSGGGRQIVRVDVTADQGRTWQVATLTDTDKDARPTQHWGWTLWTAEISVPPTTKQVEIWAKAVDSSYNTQPENVENIWNLRGVLTNSYHKVKLNISK